MLTSKMQNMSTEDDRTAFCKEICQEKKSVQKKRKNTWLLITEVIFNIKSSQPVIFFPNVYGGTPQSIHIWMCIWVGAQGGCGVQLPRGRNVQERAGPDHILLPSSISQQELLHFNHPDMFFPTTWLSWNGIRANAWLPVIAVTSSEAFLWPWICHEHNGLHMLPMEREEGEGIPKEARASLNVKASLSENSHDKSIKAHAALSLESFEQESRIRVSQRTV